MNQFATRLKKIRKEMGLSQQDLADGSGLSVATITSYEKGRTQPTWQKARRLEHYLGVSKEWLYGEEEKEKWKAEVPLYCIPAPGTPLLRETNLRGTAFVLSRHGVCQSLLVKDDSMAGMGIRKGDQVGFRQQDQVKTGDIAVVDVDGKGVLIRRIKLEADGSMKLIPHWEGRKQPWKDAEVIGVDKDGKLVGCEVIGKVFRG